MDDIMVDKHDVAVVDKNMYKQDRIVVDKNVYKQDQI